MQTTHTLPGKDYRTQHEEGRKAAVAEWQSEERIRFFSGQQKKGMMEEE